MLERLKRKGRLFSIFFFFFFFWSRERGVGRIGVCGKRLGTVTVLSHTHTCGFFFFSRCRSLRWVVCESIESGVGHARTHTHTHTNWHTHTHTHWHTHTDTLTVFLFHTVKVKGKFNRMVKPHNVFKVKVTYNMAYRCSKFNAYCLLSYRGNSQLIVFFFPTCCDLASRSRSSKRAWAHGIHKFTTVPRLNVIAYNLSEILQVKKTVKF